MNRLGLRLGEVRWYGVALIMALPLCVLTSILSEMTKGFEGSMTAQFVGQTPSLETLGAILLYGFVATGIPEEVLFRGLIGGALFRRLRFRRANVFQAIIFTIPHMLIIFVAPDLWALAILLPLSLGLGTGYLREKSGSVGPAIILHALPNTVGALSLLSWG